MMAFLSKHRVVWTRREFVVSVLLGLLILFLSLVLNYFAGTYASANASRPVNDIILDNLPVMNVDIIFIEGFVVFVIFVIGLLIYEPKSMPFVFKSLALFIVVRAFFMSLTHIGPFPEQSPLEPGPITGLLNFTGDLFFSGHTGAPFLMALVFWSQKYIRIAFLCISALFAATVLLGHWHYSIDVFAAFFITYTLFHLARNFFKSDYKMLIEGVR